MLNLHQLWLFKKVVNYGSFTLAAEELHISQPSISIQIRRLEKDLKIDLFERCGRKLKLTQAGEEFFHYAAKILDLADEAEQKIGKLKGLEGAKIRVGASTTPGNYLLPSITAEFRKQYPGVLVELLIANTRTIEDKLLSNSVDLALLGEELSYNRNLTIEPLLKDHLVVVCGKDHEMAGAEKVDMRTLLKQKFVLREKGSSTRDILDNLLEDKHISIEQIWELPSTESIKQVVLANWGLSILSYFSVRLEVSAGNMTIIPLKELTLFRDINLGCLRLKKFPPALEVFYNFLKNSF